MCGGRHLLAAVGSSEPTDRYDQSVRRHGPIVKRRRLIFRVLGPQPLVESALIDRDYGGQPLSSNGADGSHWTTTPALSSAVFLKPPKEGSFYTDVQ